MNHNFPCNKVKITHPIELCLVSLVSNLYAHILLIGVVVCLQSHKIGCADKTCYRRPGHNFGITQSLPIG